MMHIIIKKYNSTNGTSDVFYCYIKLKCDYLIIFKYYILYNDNI